MMTSEPGNARLLTRVELAAAFRVHPATVTTWSEAGMPCAQLGRRGTASLYALPDCNEWFIRRELRARGVTTNGHRLEPHVERAKLDAQRREVLAYDFEVKKGRYMLAEKAVRLLATFVVTARDQFRGLPSWSHHMFSLTSQQARVLEGRIDQILNELADHGAELSAEGHGIESPTDKEDDA